MISPTKMTLAAFAAMTLLSVGAQRADAGDCARGCNLARKSCVASAIATKASANAVCAEDAEMCANTLRRLGRSQGECNSEARDCKRSANSKAGEAKELCATNRKLCSQACASSIEPGCTNDCGRKARACAHLTKRTQALCRRDCKGQPDKRACRKDCVAGRQAGEALCVGTFAGCFDACFGVATTTTTTTTMPIVASTTTTVAAPEPTTTTTTTSVPATTTTTLPAPADPDLVCFAASDTQIGALFGDMSSSSAFAGGGDKDPDADSLADALIFPDSTSNSGGGGSGDEAIYEVTLPATGHWYLWARFYYSSLPSDQGNSFLVSIDSGALQRFGNNKDFHERFHWDGDGQVTAGAPAALDLGSLTSGTHFLKIEKREVTPVPPHIDTLCLRRGNDLPPSDAEACASMGGCGSGGQPHPGATTTTTQTTVTTVTSTTIVTTTTTTTTLPVCGSAVAPQCGGICPPREVCHDHGGSCECLPTITPLIEDLRPCSTINVFDTWEFHVYAGQEVLVRVDTIADATAADLCFDGICHLDDFTYDPFFGDDNISCTYPPPAHFCPERTFTASLTGTCELHVRLCSGACANVGLAEYFLEIFRDGVVTPVRLATENGQ